MSPAFTLSASLMPFSCTFWDQCPLSASKLLQFGPYSPTSDHCPPPPGAQVHSAPGSQAVDTAVCISIFLADG